MPRKCASGTNPIRSARPTSTAIMIFRRRSRSTHAPAKRPKTRKGANCAAPSTPSSPAEACRVRIAASGRASSVTWFPNSEIVSPTQSLRKSWWRQRLPATGRQARRRARALRRGIEVLAGFCTAFTGLSWFGSWVRACGRELARLVVRHPLELVEQAGRLVRLGFEPELEEREREVRHPGPLEDRLHRQLELRGRADSGHELHRDERVAAEGEEVVFDADPLHAQ